MYNLLRVLLKTVGYVPPDKKEEKPTETKVKTRVVQYMNRCERNPYYVPQYKRFGAWNNFTEAWIEFDNPRFWKSNHPVLDQDFEKLVAFCKTFRTYKEIEDYHKDQKRIYERALIKYTEEVKNSGKCGKVWNSE